jgi:hypothetical protein
MYFFWEGLQNRNGAILTPKLVKAYCVLQKFVIMNVMEVEVLRSYYNYKYIYIINIYINI